MSIAHRNAQQSTSGNHLPVLVQSAGVVEERSGPDAEAMPQGAWGWVQNHRDHTKFRWTRTHDFWPNAEYPKNRGVNEMKVGVLATMVFAMSIGFPIASFAGLAPDADGDGIPDVLDKCTIDSRNATPPATCDTDSDGYGNPCDGDFNQDGSVN